MPQVYLLDAPHATQRRRIPLPGANPSPPEVNADRPTEWLLLACVMLLSLMALTFWGKNQAARAEIETWQNQSREMAALAEQWTVEARDQQREQATQNALIVNLSQRLRQTGQMNNALAASLENWIAGHENLRAQSQESLREWSVHSAELTESLRVTETLRDTERRDHEAQVQAVSTTLESTQQQLFEATDVVRRQESILSSARSDLSAAESRIHCLESELSSARSALSSAECENSRLRAEISCLQSRISSLESETHSRH